MERREFVRFGGAAVVAAMAKPSHALVKTKSRIPGWFDVRDYGAAGDGRTDDTKAITAALEAAHKQGGVVWVSPGEYLTSPQVLHGGTILEGAGWQSILKLLPGTRGHLLQTPGDRANYYSVVRDLCLDGNRENGTRGDVLHLHGVTSFRVEGLRVKGGSQHGIAFSGDASNPTIAPWIRDCTIVNCTGNGIDVQGFVADCKIHAVDIGLCDKGVILPSASFLSDVSIWQCATGLYGYWVANSQLHMVRCERSKYSGFRFDGCRDITVEQCRAYENNLSGLGGHGFQLGGTAGHPSERISFTGCMSGLLISPDERQQFGFSDDGSPLVDHILVHGCTAQGNTTGGYQLSGPHNVMTANM